jgi:hypothetical protein
MSKKIFLFFIIILLFCEIKSQNISGFWNGFLYQESGGISSKYNFSLNLTDINGTISGSTEIKMFDKKNIFGKMSVFGTFSNKTFIFLEKEIITQDKGNLFFEWCIKTGELNYFEKGDTAYLDGSWLGLAPISCSPGRIVVKKHVEPKTIANNTNNNQNNNNTNKPIPPVINEKREQKDGTIITLPEVNFSVTVSESAKIDFDTISLIYNDVIVLHKYMLSNEKKTIKLKYSTNVNQNKLVLFAHNVGEIPPNTAKIEITSGSLKKEIILTSDLNESDVIIFELETN